MNHLSQKRQQGKGTDAGFHCPTAPSLISPGSVAMGRKGVLQQRLTQIEREKGASCSALPSIGDAKSLNKARLHSDAYSERGGSTVTADTNNNNNTTTNVTAEEQLKRRLQLTQTVAAHLMKAALDRQSNVFPVVVNDPETREPRMLLENERLLRPEKQLLLAPCLGLAAGANAMGGHSQRFATSQDEAARCIEKERASNRVLFSWWESRNACRQDEEEIAAVEEELRSPLWSCFRQSLTEEEAQCLLELNSTQEQTTSTMTMGSKKPLGSAATFVVADRGISMPLELYEKLFQSVMGRVHRRFLTLLQCAGKSTKDSIEMSLESRAQGTKYVQFLLKSQVEMVEAGGTLSGAGNDFTEVYPPLVSLPEERCFRPLLAAETAFGVALLWRILDQTKLIVPGMAWALQLYTRYVLPHVYDNFTAHERLLPKAGAIGEQVEQLHALQLNVVRQRHMMAATAQAKEDVRYLEGFMKSWAWRTWRHSAIEQKRREVTRSLLEKAFIRFHNVLRLRKSFSEWRLTAKEGRFAAQLNTIDGKYKTFLTSAQHAARDMQLFPGIDDGLMEPGSNIIDKNKFVALKLAETAQHVKAKQKASIVEPPPTEGENKNKENGESQSTVKRKSTRKSVLWAMAKSDPLQTPARQQQQQQQEGGENEGDAGAEAARLTPKNDTFITSVKHANDAEYSEATLMQKRAMATFEDMLQKLQEVETISGYLRQEIAIQNRIIQKLERENNNMKDKMADIEESLHTSEKGRLHYCNLLQERELDVRELERRIVQLKSRLRCQRQRPWQRTVMRVIGELCGASTTVSEYADERRVARNMRTASANATAVANGSNNNNAATAASSMQPSMPKRAGSSEPHTTATSADDLTEDGEEREGSAPLSELAPGADEERLFGQIAPLVISSTRYMPDAHTILRDWANNCLEDLESLDDLKGGALSTRFHSFSDEVRNGVLFSRLLFYLALPRYQNKTAVAQTAAEGFKRKMSTHLDFTEHRQHLLMQHNVQLDSPFPTYSECFGDLLNLKPSGRMSLLLQFATELIEGQEQLGDECIQKRLARIRDTALKATEMAAPQAVDRVEMEEVIDSYALARGDRSASLTFVALLYVRFAHPFNHKARQSAMIEREAMMYLLSNGTCLLQEHNSASPATEGRGEGDSADQSPTEGGGEPIARKLLSQLEEEDHRPWQLFLKYCQPIISTMAHPFILRGNFWPSVAFDSPDLARMLGALGIALHRSLEHHRWHIIMSCLVPVHTYSGLSRGIFTGRRASPTALQVGLEREGDWAFAMEMPCVQAVFAQREAAMRSAVEKGTVANNGTWNGDEWRNEGYFISMEKSRLMTAFGICGHDLLQLFLQRGNLAGACAMPALDLGAWRLIWMDVGLVIPDDTEKSRLDLEQLTRIFYVVATTMMQARRETKLLEQYIDPLGSQSLPLFGSGLFYPDYLAAVVLLTSEMFPPLEQGTDNSEGPESIVWLGDALSRLMFVHVVPKVIVAAAEEPSTMMKSLRENVKTHDVILKYNKALLTVFNSYCKEVCGASGMEREQLLQMLRDAMLTSTEISQNLIYDLFQPFSVTKNTGEASKEDKRREQDARLRDTAVQRRRGNVSILDPNSDQPQASGKQKEYTVLLYDGFVDFLCVLCHFKQPNPLIPFPNRLDTFLRRGLLRPLSHRNDALASIIAYERRETKTEI
ncbi:hypothetical protein DQ04_00881030 [Trypanosoma grayi]|uniref:hypothetical protein n=1 Tax=Trypanosoma grayi TaxID=71804 RepID=UPI0004F49F23|nr:hypothetical protein DQ04_00881030 [Trypanosoma grayi]KEG13635.1 hypothetical protein DQ04_00881030 [Trypanosoma grayi]